MNKKIIKSLIVGTMLFAMAPSRARRYDLNPFTAAIQAGMLAPKTVQKKRTLWTTIEKKTKSLVPHLRMIELHYAAAEIYLQNKQPDKAHHELNNIVMLLSKKPKINEWIINHPRTGLAVVRTFALLRQNKQAMELLVNINNKNPSNQEVAFLTAQFYEQQKDIKNALNVIKNYLSKSPRKPSNVAFLFLASRLHLKLGNKKNALASIEQALAMHPHMDMGWLIFAQLKEKQGELKDATKGYGNYLELASTKQKNPLGQLLFKAIETKLLKLMLQHTAKKHPVVNASHQERCRQQATEFFRQGKYKEAIKQLDRCMSKQGNNTENRLLKLQILGGQKQYEQAARLVGQWIVENPRRSLWFEALHLLYFASLDSRIVINVLHNVQKKYPHNLLTTLYLADMFTRTACSKQAIIQHHKALNLTNDKELKTSILFQLGILYYDTQQFDNMRAALERGKKLSLDKKKYQHTLTAWRKTINEKKNHLLCCR